MFLAYRMKVFDTAVVLSESWVDWDKVAQCRSRFLTGFFLREDRPLTMC